MSEQSHDSEDDLYGDAPEAQRVGDGPATRPAPTKLENITGALSAPKTRKVVIATGAAVVLAGGLTAVMLFNAKGPQSAQLPVEVQGAQVGSAPRLSTNPNNALATSPQYNAMVDQVDRGRIDAARDSGRSVQPLAEATFRDLRPVDPLGPTELQSAAVPPLSPAQLAPQPVAYSQPQYQNAGTNDPAVQAMHQAARQSMAALLAARPRGTETFVVSAAPNASAIHSAAARSQPSAAAGTTAERQQGAAAASPTYTLISAGTVLSARLDTSVNTDLPGDFIATLVTGPYAGAKLVGTSQRHAELATLVFRSLTLPDRGVTIPITASGIDAYSLEAGTATDVDRKLIAKYALKPLAAGVAAIGEAVKNAGTTVIVAGTTTVEQSEPMTNKRAGQIVAGAAAQQVASDANALNTTPTVRVAAGSIVGVQFTADVLYRPNQVQAPLGAAAAASPSPIGR